MNSRTRLRPCRSAASAFAVWVVGRQGINREISDTDRESTCAYWSRQQQPSCRPPFSLLVILAAALEVYDEALRLPTGNHKVEIAFLAARLGFITLLGIGVLRRWRWTFWLILVGFLAGVLRVPVAILQLMGILTADGPRWYVTFQGLLGVVQVAIGLATVAGHRRAGVWGEF